MKAAADRAVLTKGQKTRDTILDVAEELFGQGNFDSVSVRDVAQRAGVLVGLMGYYFKSKEALFEAVATRRAAESNRVRLEALRSYKEPTVEQILDAFIRPVLLEQSSPQWRNYLNIVAQIYNEERWSEMNKRLFEASAREFYRALRRARPDIPPDTLARGFLYVVFVLLGTTRDLRKLQNLGADVADPDDMSRVLETVVPFVVAGINRLAPGTRTDSKRYPAPADPINPPATTHTGCQETGKPRSRRRGSRRT